MFFLYYSGMAVTSFHPESFPVNVRRAIDFLKDKIGNNGCIVLFGSRTGATKKKHPDYDIGILTNQEIEWKTFTTWKSRVEDLAWSYSIDLVDLNRVPDDFREIVEKEMVLLHGTYNERSKAD